MDTRRLTLALTLAIAMAAAGCDYLPFGYTPIKEITTAPGQFEGKEVKLKGRVKSVVKLLGVKAYSLDDDTGNITVVTDGQLPAENSDVALRGVVKSAAIIGGSAIGLKVDETKRLR
jgi:hypothetical protein